MEVYMNEMMVKTKWAKGHLSDMAMVFAIIKGYKMRLNPKKCIFGVTSSKFLGYLVSSRGIETNLDKNLILINTKPFHFQVNIEMPTIFLILKEKKGTRMGYRL